MRYNANFNTSYLHPDKKADWSCWFGAKDMPGYAKDRYKEVPVRAAPDTRKPHGCSDYRRLYETGRDCAKPHFPFGFTRSACL
jgi:hypothetical protein